MTLHPAVAAELQTIYVQLDHEGKLLPNTRLDAAYQTFRVRFGPEKLKTLDGEELLRTMHSRGDNNSLVYWLEFKQDEEFPSRQLGSIAGGSAHKFGVFYSQQRATWMTGSGQNPVEISEAQAIAIARKQRDELVAGVDVLGALGTGTDDDRYAELQVRMNEVAPSVSDSAWGRKYFSLIFPDRLDDFHSPDYQRFHLIRLLQAPPQGNGRYVCSGRFVEIAAELGMRLNHFTHTINERDGGSPYRYWRVGTTEGEHGPSFWEQMKTGGYIGIGWDDVGDLSSIRSDPDNNARKSAIKQRLVQRISSLYSSEGAAGGAAGEIHRFLVDIADNDLILAANGATVLGVGRVKGPYKYAPEGRFRHRRPVDWLSRQPFERPPPTCARQSNLRDFSSVP